MDSQFFLGAALMVGGIVVAYIVLQVLGKMPRQSQQKRIEALQNTVDTLQNGYIRQATRIDELEAQVKYEQTQRKAAMERIEYLENMLRRYEQILGITPESRDSYMSEPSILLAVIGTSQGLNKDLAALRGVAEECGCFELTTCNPATLANFETLLNRYRVQGTPVKYVHFSLHVSDRSASGETVALFDDGPADGIELSGIMNGVEIAVVNGCDSDGLGDMLSVVPNVLTYREPLEHEYGHTIARLFWGAVGRGLTPRAAWRETRSKLPFKVAEALQFHG